MKIGDLGKLLVYAHGKNEHNGNPFEQLAVERGYQMTLEQRMFCLDLDYVDVFRALHLGALLT